MWDVFEKAVRGLSEAKLNFARAGEDDLAADCGRLLRKVNEVIEKKYSLKGGGRDGRDEGPSRRV